MLIQGFQFGSDQIEFVIPAFVVNSCQKIQFIIFQGERLEVVLYVNLGQLNPIPAAGLAVKCFAIVIKIGDDNHRTSPLSSVR